MLSYAELQAELRALAVQDSSVKLRIPVYEGSDILYHTKHSPLAFYTGLDSGQYRGLYNTRVCSTPPGFLSHRGDSTAGRGHFLLRL